MGDFFGSAESELAGADDGESFDGEYGSFGEPEFGEVAGGEGLG